MNSKRLAAEHGVICRLPGERFGYFGWPTVAGMDDGKLLAVASGLRTEHICPWGKTVLSISADQGRTWSPPRVINDSPLDDRDAGVVSLGGKRLLVAWFTSDTRQYREWCRQTLGEAELAAWNATLAAWTDNLVERWLGSWVMLSDDAGDTWSPPIRVAVTAPHGPIRLRDGTLLYLGKQVVASGDLEHGGILALRSADGGRTWSELGGVPIWPGTCGGSYHEPHVVELPSGRLVGMIRVQHSPAASLAGTGLLDFSMVQTDSDDGGKTWTVARPLGFHGPPPRLPMTRSLGFHGSPPHLLRHSSGLLILSYGYRQDPYGQRVAFSRDGGETWDHDWILRDDGPGGGLGHADLGYPATTELSGGTLFTVYYQKASAGEKCSLLWSRWELPVRQ